MACPMWSPKEVLMGLTVEEALIYGGATLLAAIIMSWWVLRPFERARREQKAQKHAAE